MKLKYWSCSKFADWLRGNSKPESATSEGWDAWEKNAKKTKMRYWLAEEGLTYLENIVYWPANSINALRCYINNCWITKSHALTSNLKRGSWYDFDTRLLHAAFDELVNFVEIEQAWMLVVFSEEERKKYKTPWHRTFLRLGSWRSPQAGVDYLNWAAGLKMNEDWMDKHDLDFGQPTNQALVAQETLKLYNWWKTERRNRLDLDDVSGWSNYCEENPTATLISKNDSRSRGDALEIYHKLEKDYEEEDTAMLIRLIKIRQSLWT